MLNDGGRLTDLSQLPLPAVIEELDYEAILSDHMADFMARWEKVRERHPHLPAYDVEMLETDPVKIAIESSAYRELLWRARANDVARALMLASAAGSDLDHFAADFGVERRIIGTDADGFPILEGDEEFRQRRHLAPEGYAAAGPAGAYRYFAWSADGSIRQVEAIKGENNRCEVILLGRDGDGTVDAEVISKVHDVLSAKLRRPLTDSVHVRSATITEQSVRVSITPLTGPAPAAVLAKAKASIEAYVASRHAIGTILRVDGIVGAAHAGNTVESVTVLEPAGDIDPGAFGAVHVPDIIVEAST